MAADDLMAMGAMGELKKAGLRAPEDIWKLVSARAGEWELYDIAADRTELNNLAGKHSDKVKELAARWDAWAQRTNLSPRPGGR